MKFQSLPLPAPLLRAVEDLGFEEPTAIQAQALPHLLEGKDLAGQAQTGTGKTACFLLATMKRLLEGERPADGAPRALVVAPTRELAVQIAADADNLSKYTDLKVALAFGGMDWGKQARALEAGADIVVGTPGRLIDYHRQRILKLSSVQVMVTDEADRMFDMGFVEDLNYLFRAVPHKSRRQSLLFSATLSHQVMRLARRFMNDPVEVAIRPERLVVEAIEERLYHVSSHEKFALLLGLLKSEEPGRAMIFVNTKRDGEELAWRLTKNGYSAVYMSGDLPQKKRMQIIEALKEGHVRYLVATDVASRGIHVDDVTHVFNYDVPQDPEDYVHRVGRTARAGATGKAITLACEDFVFGLAAVEAYTGHRIPAEHADDSLFAKDEAGSFRRTRGKPFVGWPLEGAQAEAEAGTRPTRKRAERKPRPKVEVAPAEATAEVANAETAEAPAAPAAEAPKKPRRARKKREDAPQAEATAAPATAAEPSPDEARRDEPSAAKARAPEPTRDEAPRPSATERAARGRRRERRRIGDGRGLDEDTPAG